MPDLRVELEKAYAREREVRDYALLRLPHEVCGIQVMPLTARHLLLLSVFRNPFVAGGFIRRVDAAQLVWILHPSYIAPTRRWRFRFRRARVMQQVAAIPTATLIDGLRDYMDEMFMDSPGSSKENKAPRMGFIASVIWCLAEKFTRDEILDMPLPELWQYLRANDPEIIFNRFSDRVKADILKGLN